MGKKRNYFELYELLEQTGFLFNPLITYTGSFLLKTAPYDDSLSYDENKDVFFLNSKVENGKNKYGEFCNKYFVRSFGNPPSKSIVNAIMPLLVSEMNADGRGRSVKFSYTPTLLLLLENSVPMSDIPDDEAELALFVKDQVKKRRDKMYNVLRLWDGSEHFAELKEFYESHGYPFNYEFLKKQNDLFTELIFVLKDLAVKLKKNNFNKDEFVDCFEKDKMILMVCKCIVDNCKFSAATEKVFHNCIVEVLQLIQNVKELELDKEFNPVIRIYDAQKGKTVVYSFADLKREVAQMLSEHPEFEIATITVDDAISKKLVRNVEATTEFGKILDAKKRKSLEAGWEFVRSSEREESVEVSTDIDAQMNRRNAQIGPREKDAYLELMRKRMFFEKTGYMEHIIGTNKFAGYVGYIYSNGIVIFEKMYEDENRLVPVREANATYVMNIDNFVELSLLSKSEIIKYIKNTVNPNVRRVYHTNNWEQRLLSIIQGSSYDAVEDKIDALIENGKIRKQGTEFATRKGKK